MKKLILVSKLLTETKMRFWKLVTINIPKPGITALSSTTEPTGIVAMG
jgi:hypothetical protein